MIVKRIISIFSIGIMSMVCMAQVSTGDQLRQEGKLKAAIQAYKNDFHKFPGKWKNTYNLACAYALTFQKDSAFHYLAIALKSDTSLWALADPDLFALTNDSRWQNVETKQIQRYQEKNGILKQPEYAIELLSLIGKDQALNYYVDQAKDYFMKQGEAPQWYYPLGAYKQEISKHNYEKMKNLIDQYGWPKYSTVGKLAADAPLLIINHYEDDDVRKEYLLQIKNSCFDGEGSCIEYAKIQDRVLVNDNKLQLYGMQFRYNSKKNLEPFPIKDPEYVDLRRKEIGLEPIRLYLKRKINYEWDVKQKNK